MLAGGALAIYVLFSFDYVVMTRFFDSMERRDSHQALGGSSPPWRNVPYRLRGGYDTLAHWLFVIAIASVVVGSLPLAQDLLLKYELASPRKWLEILGPARKNKPAAIGPMATIIGVIGNPWGFVQARGTNKPRIPTGLVVAVASIVLLFGVFLLGYVMTGPLNLRHDSNPMLVLGLASRGQLRVAPSLLSRSPDGAVSARGEGSSQRRDG
jgi:hypothetical protein